MRAGDTVKDKLSAKEKTAQKALGIIPLCDKCNDKGEYRRYFQYSTAKDVLPCGSCLKGVLLEHTQAMDRLKDHDGMLCRIHLDYRAVKRPEVLCEGCWRVWLNSPLEGHKYLDSYIQNAKIE